MSYINYLKNKLNISPDEDIIEKSIHYLANSYPKPVLNKKGFEIVDEWLNSIINKWRVEINVLNLSTTSFLGKLEPREEGFIMNLNKNLYSTQRRFTIAHELAHILSFDFSKKWPVYKIIHSKLEEHFCDKLARSMLLPKSLINFEKFDILNLTKEQIYQLKDLWIEYKVSCWQIIKKLNDESNNNSLISIYWKYIPDEGCLRIIDYEKPNDIFIPKWDRIHLNDLLSKKKVNFSPEVAFNANDVYQGLDLISIGSIYKKELFTTVFPIKTSSGTGNNTHLIQLININN